MLGGRGGAAARTHCRTGGAGRRLQRRHAAGGLERRRGACRACARDISMVAVCAPDRPVGGQRMRAIDDVLGARRRGLARLRARSPVRRRRPTASRTVARMAGERCRVFSITLLSRFSMAQANSLMSVAPTMRPEPLSVWNARRTPASASVSSGFCSQAGNSLPIRATSSRASSIYRVSSSGSMWIGLAPIGGCADWCSVGRALEVGRHDAGLQRVRARRGAGIREQHRGGVGFRAQRRHRRHHALGHLRQRRAGRSRALSSMYQGSVRPACSVSM